MLVAGLALGGIVATAGWGMTGFGDLAPESHHAAGDPLRYTHPARRFDRVDVFLPQLPTAFPPVDLNEAGNNAEY